MTALEGTLSGRALLENRRLYRRLEARNRALATANARLQAMATTDPLTEAPNHRAMVDALDRELGRAGRHVRPCGVLFIDLDRFKILNDTHGHLAGDAALRDVVALTRRAIREGDTVGRWGGEEFIAVLPRPVA